MAEFRFRFDDMLSRHVAVFKDLFVDLAQSLYVRTSQSVSGDQSVFHGSEYGALREVITEQLLKPFTPRAYSIRSGFVVDGEGVGNVQPTGVSPPRQCDLLVCSEDMAPFRSQLELGQFYLKHSVAAVGEVKSKLADASDQKEAIDQLSAQMRLWPDKPSISQEGADRLKFLAVNELQTILDYTDQATSSSAVINPFSFLICEGLRPDTSVEPRRLRKLVKMVCDEGKSLPDAILSVKDGLIARIPQTGSSTGSDDVLFVLPTVDSNTHIKFFLAMYYRHLMTWQAKPLNLLDYLRVHPSDIFARQG
ncbi:MAG: hypothetical protein RLZZ458_265 [Planctomycetota bacterium]|jgi:hypothetical protein